MVDAGGRPVGLVDITDVVGLLPKRGAGPGGGPARGEAGVWRIVGEPPKRARLE